MPVWSLVPRATAAMCCMLDLIVNETIALICSILGTCAFSLSENMHLSFSVCKLWVISCRNSSLKFGNFGTILDDDMKI